MTEHNILPNPKLDHISVCICTFKRPEMLAKALEGVISQVKASEFSYEVVVVDNDSRRSAEDTVRRFQSTNELKIIYDCEPEQNIALARNKAIENATGDLIVFIDDDEFPITTWLLELYNAYKKYGADGVLGPVKPYFEQPPPAWIVKGRFCERQSHATGTILHWDDTRTGNVLFDNSISNDLGIKFDARFGRSGGEDIDFFKKAIKSGRKFVWCEEAPVYETVPPERWISSFYLKKNFRIGGLNGERKREETGQLKLFLKITASSIIYSSFVPISILMGRHVFLRYLFKLIYNLAWFLGFFRLHVSKDR